jgi:hypothetical protein
MGMATACLARDKLEAALECYAGCNKRTLVQRRHLTRLIMCGKSVVGYEGREFVSGDPVHRSEQLNMLISEYVDVRGTLRVAKL